MTAGIGVAFVDADCVCSPGFAAWVGARLKQFPIVQTANVDAEKLPDVFFYRPGTGRPPGSGAATTPEPPRQVQSAAHQTGRELLLEIIPKRGAGPLEHSAIPNVLQGLYERVTNVEVL